MIDDTTIGPGGPQRVLNSYPPSHPDSFPDRQMIHVMVRIEWARAPARWYPGQTTRWDDSIVRVGFWTYPGGVAEGTVWVQPHDVRVIDPQPPIYDNSGQVPVALKDGQEARTKPWDMS